MTGPASLLNERQWETLEGDFVRDLSAPLDPRARPLKDRLILNCSGTRPKRRHSHDGLLSEAIGDIRSIGTPSS